MILEIELYSIWALPTARHIEDMLIFRMVANHPLVLLAVVLLLAYGHVAHGRQQGQLIATPIAQELPMRLLSTLGLVELDLWQLGL